MLTTQESVYDITEQLIEANSTICH